MKKKAVSEIKSEKDEIIKSKKIYDSEKYAVRTIKITEEAY